CKLVLIIALFSACSKETSEDLKKGLEGHWELRGNPQDNSGNDRHAIVKGDIDFGVTGPDKKQGSAIGLNGHNAWLEVPANKSPNLGNEDFSISLWINLNNNAGNVPGDLLSQYDSLNKKRFHLSLHTNAVTTSLAKYNKLHFGIDNDQMSDWTDCGRPGKALSSFSLASFD